MEVRSKNESLEPAGAVIVCKQSQISKVGQQLDFSSAVQTAFSFMVEEGFCVITSEPTIVRFKRGELIAVVYHGRQSYEIGFEIGTGDERFPLSALIRSEAPNKAAEYRNPVATTQSVLVAAVHQVAKLVWRYGQSALKGDAKYFVELQVQQQRLSEAYALDVLVSQLRPKANAAFQEGRYQAAVDMYEKMSGQLTPVEEKKLEVARRKATVQ